MNLRADRDSIAIRRVGVSAQPGFAGRLGVGASLDPHPESPLSPVPRRYYTFLIGQEVGMY